jgi:hypothetical protein
MGFWPIFGIVYGSGWVITFVLVMVSSAKGGFESINEPGDDELAIILVIFLWPITLIWFIHEVVAHRDYRRRKREKRQAQRKTGLS